ncbi:MAG: hypothetical protein CMF96_08630 [Candidatus Marinimicrobia bacterium]|nr:hypothetical protein [Candidatus Neomarinimicrobiota bacterium]MAJ44787.1 hypothetical protein [Candidatus Neomarinimicrobiota bacterium]
MASLMSWQDLFFMYGKALGWSLVASIGFAVGIGIAIKIFDLFSSDIDEWQEIKNGNIGVSLIMTSLILVIGALVYKVI